VKLKLDENLPASAAPRLAALRYDVHTVLDENLGGKHDAVVWTAAQAEGHMLVTCDLDFSDARTFAQGLTRESCSYSCRIRSNGVRQAIWWRGSDPNAASWQGCLVVATLHKVRVLRATCRTQGDYRGGAAWPVGADIPRLISDPRT